ncbi:MAG: hypothetical protein JSR46_07260, partial [Verrucomicrobia bacterium]|nr:hypothetical protein [Verrucomicrobiota bacterium]
VMGRPWYSLAHQWIAAKLNEANGVDSSCIDCSGCDSCTGNALDFVESLLNADCMNIDDKTPNATFQCLEMLLDDFNMGMLPSCPDHCGGENPCQGVDCGLCCPIDCTMCADCPNLCTLAIEADCCSSVCPCPCQPCPECPACPACPSVPECPQCPACDCEQICKIVHRKKHSSSSCSSSSHHHHSHHSHHHKKHHNKKAKKHAAKKK